MKPIRTLLRWLFNAVAVPVLLFEAWGLKPLLALVDYCSRWRLWAWTERKIRALPPYAALSLFLLPGLCLIPVKLVALYLLTTDHKLAGIAVLLLAKLVGTVIVARIFLLTRSQLLRIGWFARLAAWGADWRDYIYAKLRNSSIGRFYVALAQRTRSAGRRLLRWLQRLFKATDAPKSD